MECECRYVAGSPELQDVQSGAWPRTTTEPTSLKRPASGVQPENPQERTTRTARERNTKPIDLLSILEIKSADIIIILIIYICYKNKRLSIILFIIESPLFL